MTRSSWVGGVLERFARNFYLGRWLGEAELGVQIFDGARPVPLAFRFLLLLHLVHVAGKAI